MKISQFLVLTALCLAVVSNAFAQSQLGSGAVSGIVEDANNSAIVNASVTILNQETGLTRSVSTSESGQFNFPVLPVGIYTVTVE
jgi:hypothetical protein